MEKIYKLKIEFVDGTKVIVGLRAKDYVMAWGIAGNWVEHNLCDIGKTLGNVTQLELWEA